MLIHFDGGEIYNDQTGSLMLPDGTVLSDIDATETLTGTVFLGNIVLGIGNFSITYPDGTVSHRVEESPVTNEKQSSTMLPALLIGGALLLFLMRRQS